MENPTGHILGILFSAFVGVAASCYVFVLDDRDAMLGLAVGGFVAYGIMGCFLRWLVSDAIKEIDAKADRIFNAWEKSLVDTDPRCKQWLKESKRCQR